MIYTSLSRSYYVIASLILIPIIQKGEKERINSKDADFVPGGHIPMQKCEKIVSIRKNHKLAGNI
jgi:hypothetical protein